MTEEDFLSGYRKGWGEGHKAGWDAAMERGRGELPEPFTVKLWGTSGKDPSSNSTNPAPMPQYPGAFVPEKSLHQQMKEAPVGATVRFGKDGLARYRKDTNGKWYLVVSVMGDDWDGFGKFLPEDFGDTWIMEQGND